MTKGNSNCNPSEFEKKHIAWLHHLLDISGGVDTRGIEIAHAVRMMARVLDHTVTHSAEFGELSGPRLGILLRLMREEHNGNTAGISPTTISHFQDVKKNTITALLKGLEENGLIERSPDPEDRRGFLIRITPAGRELVLSTAPNRFRFMNQIVSVLDREEQAELIRLLEKLQISLVQNLQIEKKSS